MAKRATARVRNDPDLQALEIDLLLEALFRRSGFDFRGYAPLWRRDRLLEYQRAEGVATLSALIDRILHEPACLDRAVEALLQPDSSLFGQPLSLLVFRERVVPALRTYPYVRIWQAGCGTGLEALSWAIVMHEEGLLDRCRFYATDVWQPALDVALEGIYPATVVLGARSAYAQAGGRARLEDYCEIKGNEARFAAFLRQPTLLSHHNLVTDASFNEFQVIACHRVLSQFDTALQDRTCRLFDQSLARLGFLSLGDDPPQPTLAAAGFAPLDDRSRLLRRAR